MFTEISQKSPICCSTQTNSKQLSVVSTFRIFCNEVVNLRRKIGCSVEQKIIKTDEMALCELNELKENVATNREAANREPGHELSPLGRHVEQG